MASLSFLRLPPTSSRSRNLFTRYDRKRSRTICASFSLCNSKPNSPPLKSKSTLKFKGTQMRVKQLGEMIEKKVLEATEMCKSNQTSDECKVAWDEVEEVSRAKADLRRKLEKSDPLEFYCMEHPETDECRIYED